MIQNLSHQVVLMPADEARNKTEQIKGHLGAARMLILEIHEREGWRSLGYGSFEEWARGEFPRIASPGTIYRILKAGRLELAAGDEVGKHRESHLRPIFEMNGLDEADKIEALNRADEIAERLPANGRTAKLYESSAKSVYVQRHGRLGLVRRMNEGELAVGAAYEIVCWIRDSRPTPEVTILSDLCSDPAILPILVRLQKDGRQTWGDIWFSAAVPGIEEGVPLQEATATQLIEYLNYAAREHRISAVEGRQWEEGESMRIALESHVAMATAAAACLSVWYPGHERPLDNPDQQLYDLLVQLGYIESEEEE